MREAALLRRVPPPHAPRLHDFGLWGHPAGPLPFLVMEWIEGVPLYAWAQGQQLSSRRMLRVMAPLARTLVAVHSVQAVHRDVKGDNTLVNGPRDAEPQAHVGPPEEAARAEQEKEDSADAGVSLAKEVQSASARMEQPQPSWEGLSAEKVTKPLPGQARPPCKQRGGAVEIKGGCWWGPPEATPPCREGEYEWGDRCYHPVFAPTPPATSEQ